MVYDLLVIVFIISSAGVEECRLHFAVVFSIVCHYCHYCHYYNLILHFTFTIQMITFYILHLPFILSPSFEPQKYNKYLYPQAFL